MFTELISLQLGATGCVMNTTIGKLSSSFHIALSLTILGTAFGAGLHIVLASNNDLLVTNKVKLSQNMSRLHTYDSSFGSTSN